MEIWLMALWAAISPLITPIIENLTNPSNMLLFGMLTVVGITVLAAGFPGKAMFDTVQPGGEHAEDVAPLIEIISPKTTPLLSALGMGPYPARNIRHEWLEDELLADVVTLQGAVGAAGGFLTVPDADVFQVGELITVGQVPNDEIMRITSINSTTNQVGVSRGWGQSTAIAHASGEEILLGGEVSIEGDDAPDAQKSNMDRLYNISHIFNYAVEMTGTREALIDQHLGDVGDEFAYTKQKRLTEAMRDLEAAVLFSDWNFVGGVPSLGSATQVRTMRGIMRYLRHGALTGAGAAVTPPANCFRNVGGAAFTFNNFRTLQQQVIYQNGAEEGQADLLLIPPALKVSVAGWKGNIATVNADMNAENVAQLVGTVLTDFGTVTVLMVPRLRVFGNVSILLTRKFVKVLNLQGRSFFSIPIGKTGDRKTEEIVGEYTLEMKGISQGWHSYCYNWTP